MKLRTRLGTTLEQIFSNTFSSSIQLWNETNLALALGTESAKLRATHPLVPYVLWCLTCLVRALRAPVAHVPRAIRALVFDVPRALRALGSHVLRALHKVLGTLLILIFDSL